MIRETIASHRPKFAVLAVVCLASNGAHAAQHQHHHRVAAHHVIPKRARVVPALHVMDFMHATRSKIERQTGRAVRTAPDQVNENGYFCHYRVRGNDYVIEYQDGKATSVVLTFGAAIASPDVALRATGIDMSGRKPEVASRINRVWKGQLSPSGVRFLAVGRTSEGWNELQILDDENP